MLTLLEFNTAMEKGSVKYYFVFTATAGLILFLAYRHILECYALSDDYYSLYHVLDEYFLNIFTAQGRVVYGVMTKWLFSQFYYISDLRYVRIISLIGIVIFSQFLYRAYLLAGWRKIEGGCASIITCLMPAFGVYAAWATCFMVIYGALVGFISGELCLKSYQYFRLKTDRIKGATILVASILLLMISLMTYQPSATAFWLFIAIALFMPKKNSEDLFRKGLYCLIVFAGITMVYFILFKAKLLPFASQQWGSRGDLTNNPIEKLIFFLKSPLYDTLSLFNILQKKFIISTTVATVCGVMILGMYRRIRRIKQQKWLFLLVFFGLIPLSCLANLVSADDWMPFRSQGVLGSLIVFYLLLSLKEIFNQKVTRIIMPCLLVAFCLITYKNVTYGFIEPRKQELKLIRNAVRRPLSCQPKEILFVRPNWWNHSLVKNGYRIRYEYGYPSTSAIYVPNPLLNLIAREVYSKGFEPIKVKIFKHNEPFNKGIPVINAHRLLKGYKIKRQQENEFHTAKDRYLTLNSKTGFNGMEALHQVLFLPREDGLVLRSQGNDPHFALPLFQFSPKKQLMIKIDITSPEDTIIQLYYTTKSSPNYNEKQRIKIRISKGNNVVFIKLPMRDYTGRFRLDPGKMVGQYLLRSIEVRGISKG